MACFRQEEKEILHTMSYVSAHRKFHNCLPPLKAEMIDISYISGKRNSNLSRIIHKYQFLKYEDGNS